MNDRMLPAPAPPSSWEQDMQAILRQLFPDQNPAQGKPKVGLGTYLNIIVRWKWFVIIPMLVIPTLALILLVLEKPLYQTATTLLIEPANPKVVKFEEVVQPDSSSDYMNTQYALIKSYDAARKVIDILSANDDRLEEQPEIKKGLVGFITKNIKKIIMYLIGNDNKGESNNTNPFDYVTELKRHNQTKEFLESLTVEIVKDSRLISIIIQGNDPYNITHRVNTLAQLFVDQNLNNKREASQTASLWLEKEAENLKRQMKAAELALIDFMEQNGFTPQAQHERQNSTAVSDKNITNIELAIHSTKTQRIELKIKLVEIERVLESLTTKKYLAVANINIPLLQNLQSNYIEIQSELISLQRQYKNKHPKIKVLINQADDIGKKIELRIQDEIDKIRFEIIDLIDMEGMLTDLLNQEKDDVLRYNRNSIEYYALNNDIYNKRELYEGIMRRLNETKLVSGIQTNNITISHKATVPVEALSSKKKIKFLGSIFIALIIGLGSAIWVENRNKRFNTADEIEQIMKIPFLGAIPNHKHIGFNKTYQPIGSPDAHTHVSDVYRNLRTQVEHLSPDMPGSSLLVTSAVQGEGKSTTVINLGRSFAKLGKSILLVDADLRRPSLHTRLGVGNDCGLSDILMNTCSVHQAIQPTSIENVKLITSGSISSDPNELFSMADINTLRNQVNGAFDMIIFDAPALLDMPHTAMLASQVQCVLMVHNTELIKRESVLEAKYMLEDACANIIGIFFNNVKYGYDPQHALDRETRVAAVHPGKEWLRIAPPQKVNDDFQANLIPVYDSSVGRNNNLNIKITQVRCNEILNDTFDKEEKYYINIDLEIHNETDTDYLFESNSAAIYLRQPNKYGNAITMIYGDNEEISRKESIYQPYYLLLEPEQKGFSMQETINAHETIRGRLVYRVHQLSRDITFVYERPEIQISIPLNIHQIVHT